MNSTKLKAPLLQIKDLHVTTENTKILHGLNLSIYPGQIHAIMGPNGSGKSTLSKVLAGHPAYSVTSGEVIFKEQNLLNLVPEERSHLGVFLAFQYPIEISGVTNEDFLRLAVNSKRKALNLEEINPLEFLELIQEKLKIIGMDTSFLQRNVNEGFSGGEKKKNEILQFALLDSDLGVLDETDSGLDIDALKKISNAINSLLITNQNKSVLLITHYKRLLDYIAPDFVHVMMNGKIIKTGDKDLPALLEKNGYEWLKSENKVLQSSL